MDDEAYRHVAGLKMGMENVMTWALRLLGGADVERVQREIDEWLAVDEERRVRAMAAGGCIVLASVMRKLARTRGLLQKGQAFESFAITFPDGSEKEPGSTAVVQVVGAIARGDEKMSEDLLQSHFAVGGYDALLDIGTSAVEILTSMFVSYPDLLTPENPHGRN